MQASDCACEGCFTELFVREADEGYNQSFNAG